MLDAALSAAALLQAIRSASVLALPRQALRSGDRPSPPQDAISTDSKRTIQEIVIRPGSGLPRQGRQVQINS